MISIKKNYAICNMQLHILFEKRRCFLHQLIHLAILRIKILRYSYQKIKSLRDILYFLSKCA